MQSRFLFTIPKRKQKFFEDLNICVLILLTVFLVKLKIEATQKVYILTWWMWVMNPKRLKCCSESAYVILWSDSRLKWNWNLFSHRALNLWWNFCSVFGRCTLLQRTVLKKWGSQRGETTGRRPAWLNHWPDLIDIKKCNNG